MNKIFLTAVTGECCMDVLHGMKMKYSPFKLYCDQCSKLGVKIGRTKKDVLEHLLFTYKDNNLKPHPLLNECIKKGIIDDIQVVDQT